jgi:poly(3-hydroxybutyrate) depolymerase
LACEGSDRIASFVSAIGGFRILCEPERPVPLLAFTGDPDRTFMSSSVGWWAEMAGCQPEPVVEDLGSGVSRQTYQGCEADVLFYDIEGAGHTNFFHECTEDVRLPLGGTFCTANEVIDQLQEAERFFAEHPLSE